MQESPNGFDKGLPVLERGPISSEVVYNVEQDRSETIITVRHAGGEKILAMANPINDAELAAGLQILSRAIG